MTFYMRSTHLVLHLILTLVQVLVLETPLVLNMDVNVKLSSLSLSQLKQTIMVDLVEQLYRYQP